jgi:guanylate kinase
LSRTVFLIIGPSGSGKTSLTQSLVERVPQLTKGITTTTRLPRPGEVSGKDYHFVTPLQFSEMQRSGAFVETDYAYNESYGVPRSALDVEGDVALIVTVPGALSLQRILPDTMTLFVMAASAGTAAGRVVNRNSPNQRERIASYETEASAARFFDSVFLNLDFEQTVREMETVVLSRRRSLLFRPVVSSPLHEFN